MEARGLALAVVLAGCAPAVTAGPNDVSRIEFRASARQAPQAKQSDAWAIAGYVALGAFVTGFAVFVLFVLPQTSAGG